MDSFKKLDDNTINSLVEILLKLKIENNKYENSSKLYDVTYKQNEPIINLDNLKKAMNLRGFKFESDFFRDLERVSTPSNTLEKSSNNLSKQKSQDLNKTKKQGLSL